MRLGNGLFYIQLSAQLRVHPRFIGLRVLKISHGDTEITEDGLSVCSVPL